VAVAAGTFTYRILCAACACEEIEMAKIGTAHVEVKTVVNEEALTALSERIEAEVFKAARAGLGRALDEVGERLAFRERVLEREARLSGPFSVHADSTS
jgi:hypothetical protein